MGVLLAMDSSQGQYFNIAVNVKAVNDHEEKFRPLAQNPRKPFLVAGYPIVISWVLRI